MLLSPKPKAITAPLSEIVAQFTFLFEFNKLIYPIDGRLLEFNSILFESYVSIFS